MSPRGVPSISAPMFDRFAVYERPKLRRGRRPRVLAEDFIREWLTCRTVEDVCIVLGMSQSGVYNRLARLRAKGVAIPRRSLQPTKRDPHRLPPERVESLNRLVEELRPQRDAVMLAQRGTADEAPADWGQRPTKWPHKKKRKS